jgi:hypothetical protein
MLGARALKQGKTNRAEKPRTAYNMLSGYPRYEFFDIWPHYKENRG